MAKKAAGSQDDSLSMGEVNLDDLSLDDEALFADLDNEVKLSDPESLGDELAGDKGLDLDIDFNVTDETATPEQAARKAAEAAKNAKAGKNGKAGKPAKAAAKDTSKDLDLNLDDLQLDDLDLGASGGAKGGDDLMDLTLQEGEGSGEEELHLDADDLSATSELDSDLEEGLALPDDLDLNLEDAESAPAAKGAVPAKADDLDLDALSLADEDQKPAAGGDESLELDPLEGLEAAEHEPAPGAAKAIGDSLDLLDMEDLPGAGAEAEPAAGEDFQAAPDVDLDSLDLNLEAPGQAASGADMPIEGFEMPPLAPKGPALDKPKPFVAVPDVRLPQDDVLELNLEDLEPGGAGTPPPPRGGMPPATTGGRMAAVPPLAGPAGILLSIPHQIQVRIGSVSLLGKEIMDLGYGSVVQLNRSAGEPVDLQLEGKTIAQGEIVLINGKNLGVRIVALNK